MKAYKVQMHQMFLEKDYFARLTCYQQFNEKINTEYSSLNNLMFSISDKSQQTGVLKNNKNQSKMCIHQ